MNEKEERGEKKIIGLEIKDWVIIGLSVLLLLFMIGYFRSSSLAGKMESTNKQLNNDIQFVAMLSSTLIEIQQKEADVNNHLCEEKLNRGYLDFYEKLKMKSDSTRYFKKMLAEAIEERERLTQQRNDKAALYNEYSKSFDWGDYENSLYNLPKEIQMIK